MGSAPSALTVGKCETFDPLKRAENSAFGLKKTSVFCTHTEKNHEQLTARRGGSTLTVSLTVKFMQMYNFVGSKITVNANEKRQSPTEQNIYLPSIVVPWNTGTL